MRGASDDVSFRRSFNRKMIVVLVGAGFTMPPVDEREIWLFDFDGTLVDSEAVIMASFRHATGEILGHVPPDEILRAGIGMTLERAAP